MQIKENTAYLCQSNFLDLGKSWHKIQSNYQDKGDLLYARHHVSCCKDKKRKEQCLPLGVLQYGKGETTFRRNSNSQLTQVRSMIKMQGSSNTGTEENKSNECCLGKSLTEERQG